MSPLAWLFGPGSEGNAVGGEPVRDFVSMKWLVAVLFAGVPVVVYLLARDCLGEASAWAAALLCAAQPKLVEYGSQVMSEIPYTLFSLATLFLVRRGARIREGLTNPWLT
ncbi:MAG: glycosyltransferase family 39 protein, partial [Gemmatimonadetes bacterium]|nr:glycosyltransferase family 39 protein [Gemmatimonadota bacterium]